MSDANMLPDPNVDHPHSNLSYEVAVLCDEYNLILFKLFNVYSCERYGDRYHSVDDHLSFLYDYGICPQFLSRDSAISNFMAIVTQRNDASNLAAANYMNYEMFVEGLARIALLIYNTRSLKTKNMPVAEKLTSFFTMWNLGDENLLVIHREERSIAENE